MGPIQRKRAYDPPAPEDGARFLVDALWPRGVRKEALGLAGWLRDLAPSTELRRWFAHRGDRWEAFRERYREELEAAPECLASLIEAAGRGPVTLVYAAKDTERNNAVVLEEVLREQMPPQKR